jgi:hypothetical protein
MVSWCPYAPPQVFDHFHADRFGILPCLLPLLWSPNERLLTPVLTCLFALAAKRRHRVLIANVALPMLLNLARDGTVR